MRSNTVLAGIVGGRTARDSRDEKLWSLLPAKDAPYDYHSLSKAETDALVEALTDGFGGALVQIYERLPLPTHVTSGLLEHSFYSRPNSGYDPDEWDHRFWSSVNDDDAPAPYEEFPLGFHARRLRVYLQNQFQRFCIQEFGGAALTFSSHETWAQAACTMLYAKPWYEFHALQYLDWMESSVKDLLKSKAAALHILFISTCSGQLGRLVEQYYWRFRFEGAAITGRSAQRGASAGGKAKAELHQAEHSMWQNAATKIWADRPGLSKIAVAKILRKQFGGARTAKHIARYITHP
jgi:hypothetical protein